jgi:hypothetical protein
VGLPLVNQKRAGFLKHFVEFFGDVFLRLGQRSFIDETCDGGIKSSLRSVCRSRLPSARELADYSESS